MGVDALEVFQGHKYSGPKQDNNELSDSNGQRQVDNQCKAQIGTCNMLRWQDKRQTRRDPILRRELAEE